MITRAANFACRKFADSLVKFVKQIVLPILVINFAPVRTGLSW